MNSENFTPSLPFAPKVGRSYSIGWELMMKYFLELLLLIVIGMAIQIPVQLMTKGANYSSFDSGMIMMGLLGMLLFAVAVKPVSYGIDYVNLKLVRGEKFDIADVFLGFRENYLNVVLSGILVAAIVIAGFILLIIPGIIFACKLAFVPYLVIDKKLDAVEAVKASWEMTDGHAMTIFLMALLAIPIAILGLIALVVGIIPAAIWINAASASMYHSVDLEKFPQEISTNTQ
jgi:uncharacterized membrane protein